MVQLRLSHTYQDMPVAHPYHALTMPFFSRPRHSTAIERQPCCAVALKRTAWSEHGMTSVNQTQLHCGNQMGKTHSKPLAAWHGRGTAQVQHGHSKPCVNRPYHIPDDWSPKHTHTSCSLGVCENHCSRFWPLKDHPFSWQWIRIRPQDGHVSFILLFCHCTDYSQLSPALSVSK